MRKWMVLPAIAAAAGLTALAWRETAEEPPPGVQQLLPRGRIAAVFEPVFVPAAEADIPSDAWILGVEIEGETRAYSLSLLNTHEVVNDRIAGSAFAAVW